MKMNLPVILFLMLLSNPIYTDSDLKSIFYSNVVSIAEKAIGMTELPVIKGEKFRPDCIGFVRYVYYRAGLDLVKVYGNGRGGVSSLYDGLEKRGLVYTGRLPEPGDLIFFDNTYDVNGNSKWDDPLSHIAIVEAVGKHNTIYYIDYSNSRVSEERLNLSYPNTHAFRQADGKYFIINSFLRRDRGEGLERKDYVSSFFFRAFAHIRVNKRTA